MDRIEAIINLFPHERNMRKCREEEEFTDPVSLDYSKSSRAFQMLRDEMVCLHRSKKTVKPMENNKAAPDAPVKVVRYIPGLCRHELFPRQSAMSYSEMKCVFQHYVRLTNGAALDPAKQQFYFDNIALVKAEQEEFLRFAEDQWKRGKHNRHLEIIPDVKKYIDEIWENRLSRISKCHRFYVQEEMIPLVYSDTENPIKMEFVGLCVPGSVQDHPKILIKPKLTVPQKLCTDYKQLTKNAPRVKTRTLPAVSEDAECEALAWANNVQVVLSAGGLKAIADNHFPNFATGWELPVMVKESISETGSVERVVFVDQPLPPHSLSLTERNQWHAKIASSLLLCHFAKNRLNKGAIPAREKIKYFQRGGENVPKMSTEMLGDNGEVHQTVGEMQMGQQSAQGLQQRTRMDDGLLPYDDVLMDDQCVNISLSPNKVTFQGGDYNSGDVNEKESLKRRHSETVEVEDSDVESVSSESRLIIDDDLYLSSLATQQCSKIVAASREKTPDAQECSQFGVNGGKRVVREVTQVNGTHVLSSPIVECSVANTVNGDQRPATQICSEAGEDAGGIDAVGALQKTDDSKLAPGFSERKKNNIWSLPEEEQAMVTDTTGSGTPLVSYRVWRLSKSEDINPLMGQTQSSINVLVRTKVQAIQMHPTQERIPLGSEVCVSGKLEFQPEYGAEAATLSEMTRDWVDMTFRPQSTLARVRVNATTKEVIHVERQTQCQAVNHCMSLYKVNLHTKLGNIYSVLERLIRLPAGTYLVSHAPKNGAFATLYRAVTKPRQGAYDLYAAYSQVRTVDVAPPRFAWLPIDTGVLTPTNFFQSRLPATFPPNTSTFKKKAVGNVKAAMKRPEGNKIKVNKKKKKGKNKKTKIYKQAAIRTPEEDIIKVEKKKKEGEMNSKKNKGAKGNMQAAVDRPEEEKIKVEKRKEKEEKKNKAKQSA